MTRVRDDGTSLAMLGCRAHKDFDWLCVASSEKWQNSYGVTEKKEKEETPKAAVGIVLLVCYGACSSCSNSTFHLF